MIEFEIFNFHHDLMINDMTDSQRWLLLNIFDSAVTVRSHDPVSQESGNQHHGRDVEEPGGVTSVKCLWISWRQSDGYYKSPSQQQMVIPFLFLHSFVILFWTQTSIPSIESSPSQPWVTSFCLSLWGKRIFITALANSLIGFLFLSKSVPMLSFRQINRVEWCLCFEALYEVF